MATNKKYPAFNILLILIQSVTTLSSLFAVVSDGSVLKSL